MKYYIDLNPCVWEDEEKEHAFFLKTFLDLLEFLERNFIDGMVDSTSENMIYIEHTNDEYGFSQRYQDDWLACFLSLLTSSKNQFFNHLYFYAYEGNMVSYIDLFDVMDQRTFCQHDMRLYLHGSHEGIWESIKEDLKKPSRVLLKISMSWRSKLSSPAPLDFEENAMRVLNNHPFLETLFVQQPRKANLVFETQNIEKNKQKRLSLLALLHSIPLSSHSFMRVMSTQVIFS